MSGFAGMVSTGDATPDANLLERMAAGLGFRGPDATQTCSQAGAGFCFTLLRSGPAPQSSEQPCSLDGRVWLLGDARLDGREDLRRELEQSAESFALNATDEELILRAWRQWGEAGLARLLGDLFLRTLGWSRAPTFVCARLNGSASVLFCEFGRLVLFQ